MDFTQRRGATKIRIELYDDFLRYTYSYLFFKTSFHINYDQIYLDVIKKNYFEKVPFVLTLIFLFLSCMIGLDLLNGKNTIHNLLFYLIPLLISFLIFISKSGKIIFFKTTNDLIGILDQKNKKDKVDHIINEIKKRVLDQYIFRTTKFTSALPYELQLKKIVDLYENSFISEDELKKYKENLDEVFNIKQQSIPGFSIN